MNDIFIEEYIPAGYENRISRGALAQRTGLTDRKNRTLIEEARERGCNIYSDNAGYFTYRDERDKPHVQAYILAETRRFKTMSHKKKLLTRAWAEIEPDGAEIPGQMRLEV